MARSRPVQDIGAGVRGGAGCQHVVDQQDGLSGNATGVPFMDGKGTAEILATVGSAPAALGTRGSLADKQVRDHDRLAQLRDLVRQDCRLVEPSAQQAPSVHRDRYQHVRLVEQGLAGCRHPARERNAGVGAVSMLEPQHQMPAAVVVSEHGACAPINRRAVVAVQADGPLRDRRFERITTGRAHGAVDERDVRPAARAEMALSVDHRAASQASRR